MHRILLPFLASVLAACSSGNASDSQSKAVQVTDSVSAQHPTFFADSAYSYIDSQVKFGPRIPGSKAHEDCERFLTSKLRSFGADSVTVQRGVATAFDGKQLPIANIMAQFNSSAPKRLLLLAHYDTRPWADNEADESNHTKPIDGANDGASGVGVILEIARVLSQSKPNVGIDILFTDVEDYGTNSPMGNTEDTWCLGTQHWVANLPYSPDNRPAYGILLDMVGGRNAKFAREYYSARMAPAVVDRVWSIAAASPYADRFPNANGGAITDDHLHVNSAGIPCIDIIETTNPESGGFPPTWHTLDDNIDNIDKATLKAVGEVLLDVIYSEPSN